MVTLEGLDKCPTCGAALKKKINKGRLLSIVGVGAVLGFGVGVWFVNWWFAGGGFTHTMAVIHEVAGVILGGLIGWGIGIYVLKR